MCVCLFHDSSPHPPPLVSQQICRMHLLFKLWLLFFTVLQFHHAQSSRIGDFFRFRDADPVNACSGDEAATTLSVVPTVNPAWRMLLQKYTIHSLRDRISLRSRSNSYHHSPSPSLAPSPSPSRKLNPPAPARTSKITSAMPQKVSKSHVFAIGLFVAGGALIIIVSVAAIMVCQSSRMVTVKPWSTGLSGQLQKAFVSGVPKLQRSELETACEDFSNIIGTLTDSTVYKGTLSNGVEIAVVSSMVKSSQQWSKDLQTQFRKKIETLSKVNHKNFVNILGYCEEEKPFTRMMVFEYAPNGTLFEHLHIQEAERLNWKMRLRIIMGMSYCLDYMHELDPPIPHRDLHSSSVHLSDDYAAKVSDFSFWTEATSKKMHSSSMRSPSMQLLEASTADIESNVYSFGVLLFEIITGKIPYADDGTVKDCVWEYLVSDDLPRDAIDPTLEDGFEEEDMEKIFEIIKECVNPDFTERPTMREVSLRLKEVTSMEPEGAVPRVSPLWWAELEIMVG